MKLWDSIKSLPVKVHKYKDGEACILFGVTDLEADIFDGKWEQGVWTGLPSEDHAKEMANRWNLHLVLLAEMVRYLPVIERAEQDPELWARLTAGTGIATANGYREAIRKTQPNLEVK